MLAVVKKHRTDIPLFKVKGDIPDRLMDFLKNEFGQDLDIVEEHEELADIFDTDWYKEVSLKMTPGDALKIYRENLGLTPAELAGKIGELTGQKLSDMEKNKCESVKVLHKN